MVTESPFRNQFHDSDEPGPQDPKHPMHKTHASKHGIWLLIIYGASVFAVLIWLILTNLPNLLATQQQKTTPVSDQNPTNAKGKLPPGANGQNNLEVEDWELRLLRLVLCFGAAGGLLHLFASLGRHVGERTLQRSWLLFYYLRPPVGAGLGLFFYLILRMGVLSNGSGEAVSAVNVYGVLTFAGLAGMFSRQAIDKLAEVFEMLFQKTRQDIGQRDARQLFADPARDDVSVPLPPAPPPTESFKDEEPTKE